MAAPSGETLLGGSADSPGGRGRARVRRAGNGWRPRAGSSTSSEAAVRLSDAYAPIEPCRDSALESDRPRTRRQAGSITRKRRAVPIDVWPKGSP